MVSKTVYHMRRQLNVCTVCGNPDLATPTTCQKCREKINNDKTNLRRKQIRKIKRSLWKKVSK